MRNVAVVGTGDHFAKNLSPSLSLMQKEGLVEVVATVDVREKPETTIFGNVSHIIRKVDEPLGESLSGLRDKNPVVILGHANELHAPDANDLVSRGFDVMIEKPYSVSRSQLTDMKNLITARPEKASLMEYYASMKASPVLALGGEIKSDSFYFTKEGVLKPLGKTKKPVDMLGKFKDFVGKPRSVLLDILEGEGDYGKLDHRGAHIIDKRTGGGMIQDLGIHAIAPVFAIHDYIGTVNKTFYGGKIKTAKCEEYIDMASEKFNLSGENVGETYAEMDLQTSRGVPVHISVGKYVLPNKNQRRMIIIGSNGQIFHDLTNNVLALSEGDEKPTEVLECPKTGAKYYAVVRSSLETLQGNSPFRLFDANQVYLASQEFVLNALDRKPDDTATYRWGAKPDGIF